MNMDVQKQTKSLNAIFGWIGGKRLLREKIAHFIPEQDIPIKKRKTKYYIEVFGGVAWLLLYKERWFETEIYNDYNGELTNLFSIIKHHPRELIRQLKLLPQSEVLFNYLKDNEVLTDIQRAIKTYFKYAYSFSSNGSNFALQSKSRINLYKNIVNISKRFENTVISKKSYEKIITRFNKESVFLYLDPPYYEKEYLYEVAFSKEDHLNLRDQLKSFKGKFILSYNDCNEIRELYKDFRIENVKTNYSAFRKGSESEVNELLILNY